MVDDASIEPPNELSAEEVAQASEAFEATFRRVAMDVLATRREAADPPAGAASAAMRAVLDVVIAGLAGAVAGGREGLGAIYDGRPADCMLGTPTEARAWRELREGDAELFLRVYGHRSGLDAVRDKLEGLVRVLADEAAWQDADRDDPEAQDAAAKPRFGDERDGCRPATFDAFTVRELHEWAQSVIAALDTVKTWRVQLREAEMAALARGGELDPELQSVAALSDSDLMIYALKGANPRGYARGERREQRRIEYLERRRKRLLKSAVE